MALTIRAELRNRGVALRSVDRDMETFIESLLFEEDALVLMEEARAPLSTQETMFTRLSQLYSTGLDFWRGAKIATINSINASPGSNMHEKRTNQKLIFRRLLTKLIRRTFMTTTKRTKTRSTNMFCTLLIFFFREDVRRNAVRRVLKIQQTVVDCVENYPR